MDCIACAARLWEHQPLFGLCIGGNYHVCGSSHRGCDLHNLPKTLLNETNDFCFEFNVDAGCGLSAVNGAVPSVQFALSICVAGSFFAHKMAFITVINIVFIACTSIQHHAPGNMPESGGIPPGLNDNVQVASTQPWCLAADLLDFYPS